MNNIKEMIKNLCPNGVEYKTIKDVCTNIFSGGTPKTSNDEYYGGNIPWLRSGEINFNEIKDAEIKITEKGLNESSAKWIKPKSVLIALTGATVARSAVNEIAITANQSVCAMEVSDSINYKYLYYVIANRYNEIKGMAQGALTSINLSIIKSIKIAVPPREIQDEIVHILDDFTLLSAELSSELKARKQQYNYYRNALLSIEGKEYKLGDIANFKTGNKPKEILGTGEYEYINAGTTNSGYSNEINIDGDKVTTPSRGEGGIGFVGYKKDDFWLGPLCYAIWSKDENIIINKYLYYELSSKKDEILKRKNTGGVPSLNGCDLKTIPINVPTIDEQKRIVNILDNFEKICEDKTEGLPAEIEARNKQYEYYRDILLDFKELKVSEVQ